MTPLEVIRQAEGMTFENEDGYVDELKLLPPLSDSELRDLEARIPCPLPAEARDLLSHCRGFEGGSLESINFSGLYPRFGQEEIFPCGIPIAHDGFGNYWIVDLTRESTTWGPIFFACHDAPVIVYQTSTPAHFISEVIRFGNPPWKSEIDDVHEKYHHRIWSDNPGMMPYEECLNSGDNELVEFARSLGDKFLFIDLRNARVGDGFSWGRYGPQTVNKRFGEKRIFVYEVRKSFWQRLLGRKYS